MKIRNGFVSNSSSSSFIIAVKETAICDKCGRYTIDIIDLIKRNPYGNTGLEASGFIHICKVMTECYLLLGDKLEEIIDKLRERSINKEKLYLIDVDFNDKILEELIRSSLDIEILEELH